MQCRGWAKDKQAELTVYFLAPLTHKQRVLRFRVGLSPGTAIRAPNDGLCVDSTNSSNAYRGTTGRYGWFNIICQKLILPILPFFSCLTFIFVFIFIGLLLLFTVFLNKVIIFVFFFFSFLLLLLFCLFLSFYDFCWLVMLCDLCLFWCSNFAFCFTF